MFQFPLSDVVLFSAYAEVFPLCHPVSSFFHLFSAYAEVFPACWASRFSWSAFLCLRRGVSYAEEGATLEWVFSLPTQRCFRYEGETRPAPDLFSAYAEVFPSRTARAKRSRSFLCLRRGVSSAADYPDRERVFSLPTQRCFPPEKGKGAALDLFSAYAEVFPVVSDALAALAAFLCLRRGVSLLCKVDDAMLDFSLPTQRCF